MIPFDQVVQILVIGMYDIVEMRIVPMIDFLDHLSIGRCFVRADRNWTVQPDPFN